MKLLWMFPDILNLHGDRGNVMALSSIARAMGLNLEIVKASDADSVPDPGGVDLVLLGAGQLRDMPTVAEALSPLREAFRSYAEAGGAVLATGSGGCLLGTAFYPEGGEPCEGLGLLDMTARELCRTAQPMLTKEVYGDDIYWRTEEGTEIIGCQIQRMDFTLGASCRPLGETLYGYGNDLSGAEGAKIGNVLFTNTVGPLLACAPWFGVKLLSGIAERRGEDISGFREEDVPFMAYARASFSKKRAFILEKKKLPGIVNKLS